METFDDFCTDLIEQAKRFLEKSIDSNDKVAKRAYLNASLLLTISALDAYINGISTELLHIQKLEIIEKSILSEREYGLKKGKIELSNKLKIYRTIERIEYLHFKFTKKHIDGNEHKWWPDLTYAIDLRNKIVHPKENVILTAKHVESAINSVLSCVNCLYNSIYGKGLPLFSIGIKSRYEF